MSGGGACARFKQNAWKKELCSNCYRPKEEHIEAPRPPPPQLRLLEPSQGILVVNNKKKVKKKSVSFTKEESEVIGYGGADSSSEEEDDDYDWSDPKEEEREVVGDDEKALERLTKSNTDFNSVLGNLSAPGILPLGKQQKQTLHVTIQPFSMSDSRKPPAISKILEDMPLITTKTDVSVKEANKEDVCIKETEKQQQMPLMKTIIIENKVPKEETRGTPEGRKTQITRGNVITKTQGEQVKNKLYIQSVMNGKCENKRSITQLKDENEKKTDSEINKIIINTGPNIEEKNNRNLQQNIENKLSKECSSEGNEVTVKVLKLVGDGLAESREMAGEPDGKADSDEPETPLTPPPRSSFLHRDANIYKESNVQRESPTSQDAPVALRDATPKEIHGIREISVQRESIQQRDSMLQLTPTECRGPLVVPCTTPPPVPASPPPSVTPPATPSPPSSPQQLLPLTHSPPASPPARSKRPAPKPPVPEPFPRRRGSVGESNEKKKTKMRQTLRKLLRFGSKEEEIKTPEEEGPPRPRPQIIHPLDLNKSAVQVLPPSSEKNSPEIYASTTSIATYSVGRPSKPPPPPRSESLNLMERLKPSPNSENNVYANLEGRCGITPVKPQRTGSLRDSNSLNTKEIMLKEREIYKQCTIQTDSDNVYECVGVSSAPECDMSLPPYYGSETESDIYYPYITFQNGEYKTKMKRKERGIVHSTLEENYGAVTIANHDTLTHLLLQTTNKKPDIPREIEGVELKWSSFDLDDEEEVTQVGNFHFINSKLNDLALTLALGPADLNIPDVMEPLTKFKCNLPTKYSESTLTNGAVTVLKRKKIERLTVYARKLERSAESIREGVQILLQVVKHLLTAKGKVNVDNFIVFTSLNSPCAAYLPIENNGTLSTYECLIEMCKHLIGPLPLGRVLEKCNISEAESVLEVWLWGPASPLALPSLARWLDLERANFLNSLVCNRNVTIDKEQLSFLVRSTPKSIAHSSQIIEHNAT